MPFRRAVVTSSVALACLIGLGTFTPTGALASCVGPQLTGGTGGTGSAGQVAEGPPVSLSVRAGDEVLITGEWFREGCDDTSGGPGCSGPSSATATETPLQDVQLVFEQGGTSWTLGTADASGKDERYAVQWRALIPAGAHPGAATLRAGTGQLAIVVNG